MMTRLVLLEAMVITTSSSRTFRTSSWHKGCCTNFSTLDALGTGYPNALPDRPSLSTEEDTISLSPLLIQYQFILATRGPKESSRMYFFMSPLGLMTSYRKSLKESLARDFEDVYGINKR